MNEGLRLPGSHLLSNLRCVALVLCVLPKRLTGRTRFVMLTLLAFFDSAFFFKTSRK